ncbi:L-lysine 2,3-aminomutase [Desulfocicer vacuolatum DSM 3385]|uniref:L-lysine 2,3-aminomutase n=1 Tax=Desulfocicer vacuolatum DSM 3385 TaxID=1121400 RepID=A0A1W2DCU9_9BACT|nr:L-lysine 2,3-aminomutase [Desulfocicer vacuolatum DSM 3385]
MENSKLKPNQTHTEKSPWQNQVGQAITSPAQLPKGFNVDIKALTKVTRQYPMLISPYYLSLIENEQDPLWKQAVPDVRELEDEQNMEDPLAEEPQSPVPAVIHRYPGRVIFLVSNRCAMYCRHCMRKRKVGEEDLHFGKKSSKKIEEGLQYIQSNTAVNEVILSGGDPLLLGTEQLDRILSTLKTFDHVRIIRIHTRTLCTLPCRITDNLVMMLKKYQPLYINTHFNHPREITPESTKACEKLANAGISLGCQTVLLKGVNDDADIMGELMTRLLEIRVKPYYLHHPDPVAGTAHFRPDINVGFDIMKHMRGRLSGMCIPQYMIDLPGGEGKVPMLPDYVKSRSPKTIQVENYQGKICNYPL